jgi:hypothetical protein
MWLADAFGASQHILPHLRRSIGAFLNPHQLLISHQNSFGISELRSAEVFSSVCPTRPLLRVGSCYSPSAGPPVSVCKHVNVPLLHFVSELDVRLSFALTPTWNYCTAVRPILPAAVISDRHTTSGVLLEHHVRFQDLGAMTLAYHIQTLIPLVYWHLRLAALGMFLFKFLV